MTQINAKPRPKRTAQRGSNPSPVVSKRPATKASSAASKRKSRMRHNATIKLTRRLHLYFGLILVPFVLLYGVTAILFNHQSWFSTSTTEAANEALFAEMSFQDPESIAAAIISELNEQSEIPIEPVEGDTPVFKGEMIVDLTADSERLRYRVNPNTMFATLQRTPTEQEEEVPDAIDQDSITPTENETIDGLVAAMEGEHEDAKSRIRSMPDVQFRVLADGEDVTLTCDLQSGKISQRRTDEPRMDFNLRSFLLRLHKSRGYPSEAGTRTGWAIIVDVTGFLMIFWGLSGIIMWWQMKPLRNNGMLTMIMGIVLAGILGYGMFNLIYY